MNEADSQYLAERARSAGYSVVERPEDASILVVNTCTVRDTAEARAYGRINHFKVLKDADPARKLLVAGCLAEQDRDRMQALVPHVDGVFGTKDLVRMGDAIVAWRPEFADDPDVDADALVEPALLQPLGGSADCVGDAYSHLRAFVTVQRGCSYYCTFCIVPHVRGRFDHRPMGDILAEVRAKLAAGAREVMLVGQTVNAYVDPASGADFASLLETVAAIEGLERLTFVTSHPKDFTPRLARTMGALPNLNPRFHLPMQSGSDAVLRRMNRKYTVAQYLEKVATYREHCGEAWALTTDLIVGFPGETEDDFTQTLAVCERVGFAQGYMFVYSQRRGTPAARWEPIPADVASARFARLVETVDAGVQAWHDRKVGSVVRVLIEGPSRKDRTKLAGKTIDNVTVIAPDTEGEAERPRPEEPWIDMRVERGYRWGCTGTIVGRARTFDGPARAVAPPAIDLLALV
jgi:tRNA-2-methylthio-N6-dimethylallyladenosine synthase